jgi:periplasmic copper chaperone A
MRTNLLAAAAAAAALMIPATASAHVSLHPNEVPTGAFATLDIRVPNESDKANTTKIAVQLPAGFTDVSPEYMQGWTPSVRTAKLAKPVKSDDGVITEGVREIVWSGGKIPPGQFLNFPISTEIPGKAGETLTFKVLQYYDDGEVARWIGGPDSEEPAPDIDVTAAGGPLQDVAGSEAEAPSPGGEAGVNTKDNVLEPVAAESSGGGGASKGLAIAALVVGALGLLAGGAALVRGRGGAA